MAMWVMAVVGRGAVPMFLAGREEHDVAGANFLDRAALALRPAAAQRDDEDLAERVRMPGGARAGLERDRVAGRPRGSGRLETAGRCGPRR